MPKIPTANGISKWPLNKAAGIKKAERRVKKMEQLIVALAKQNCQSLSAEKQTRLETVLRRDLGLQETKTFDAEAVWDAAEKSDHRLVMEKADDVYLQVIKKVWRLFEYIASSQERLEDHIPILAERAGMKITGRFDPLIATFRSFVKYDNRRKWSRDAQAVRWLKHKNVTPNGILKYQKENGGGVDSWAKLEQGRRRAAKGNHGDAVKKTPTAAKCIRDLGRQLMDGDRVVLMLKKVGPKLVSQGYHELPNKKLKYWPLLKATLAKAK